MGDRKGHDEPSWDWELPPNQALLSKDQGSAVALRSVTHLPSSSMTPWDAEGAPIRVTHPLVQVFPGD